MFLLSLSFLTSLNLRRNCFTLKLQAVKNILMNTIKLQALLYNYPNPKIEFFKKDRPRTRPTTGRDHLFPCEMTSEKRAQKFILMACHYPDLDSASDWLKQIFLAAWPIRSSTQIGEVTCHQYGISALVSQMSFRGETILMALRKVGCFVRQILFAFVIFHRSGEVTMKRIVLICYGLFVTMTLMSNALFVSWDKNANLTRDDIFIGFRQIYVPKVFGSVTPAFRNLTSHSLDERCSKGMALSISWSLHEPYSGVLGPKIGKQRGFAARGIFPSEYEPYQTKHSNL